MGFNTVVVVLNDALGTIEDDTSWGQRLSQAVRGFQGACRQGRSSNVSAHSKSGYAVHCNAAEVISVAHADNYQIVVAHGNTGWVITSDPEDGVPQDVIKAIEWSLKARRAAAKKKAAAA